MLIRGYCYSHSWVAGGGSRWRSSAHSSHRLENRNHQTSDGEPRPVIVRPTDDALFRCGFVMMWQAESLYFSVEDVARVRDYLLKGGFIWSDDSWGSYASDNFAHEMAKVLPPSEFPFIEFRRITHCSARGFLSNRASDSRDQFLVGYWRSHIRARC